MRIDVSFLEYYPDGVRLLGKLQDASIHEDVARFAGEFLKDKVWVAPNGEIDYRDSTVAQAMSDALERAHWADAKAHDLCTRAQLMWTTGRPKPTLTGKVWLKYRGPNYTSKFFKSIDVTLRLDPKNSVALFCHQLSYRSGDRMIYNALATNEVLRNDASNEKLAIATAQKSLDDFLDRKADFDWRGEVKVEAVELTP